MVSQVQCLGPCEGCSSSEVADYVNKLEPWLYILALDIWLSRGLGEMKRRAQVTLNSFVL